MDYLILLSSIALGAITFSGCAWGDPRHVKILNAFTGAYLLTLVMMHLLPDLYAPEPGLVIKPLLIGGFILFGFFSRIAMDSFSMGIWNMAMRMRFMDAWLTGFSPASASTRSSRRWHWGSRRNISPCKNVASHHFLLRQAWSCIIIPISIALLSMLLQSGMRKSSALACLGLFAIMAPIGMFFSTHTAGWAVYSR